MIISFADAVGGTNNCNPALTAPDGIADVIVKGQKLVRLGLNNFQTFVMGTGPDRRGDDFRRSARRVTRGESLFRLTIRFIPASRSMRKAKSM